MPLSNIHICSTIFEFYYNTKIRKAYKTAILIKNSQNFQENTTDEVTYCKAKTLYYVAFLIMDFTTGSFQIWKQPPTSVL